MRASLFLPLLIVCFGVVYSQTLGSIGYDSPELYSLRKHFPKEKFDKFEKFVSFMRKYEKRYESVVELHARFKNFLLNLRQLAKSQVREQSATVRGVTQFFDLTFQEFKERFTGVKLTHKKRALFGQHDLSANQLQRYRDYEAPKRIDWRKKGAVTPVKNQGQCGSCFTFGAIGAIEGQWFKKTGRLISFSEEQVLDCGDDQCGGGDPLHVYDTIAEIGGLETEADYPYTAGDNGTNSCTTNEKNFVAFVNGSIALPMHDEELLKKILAIEGPIEINIDADWLFDYDSGIIDPEDQEKGSHPELINHAVLLVGYGVDKGTPFWNIKNSWGTKYGENGYFRVARGSNKLYIGKFKAVQL